MILYFRNGEMYRKLADLFREEEVYIIQLDGEYYIKPPAIGLWVVYCIKIGQYIYYGSTNYFEQRKSCHITQMNNKVKGKKHPVTYNQFPIDEIIKNEFTFEIIAFCKDGKQARKLEYKCISSANNCLNIKRQQGRFVDYINPN